MDDSSSSSSSDDEVFFGPVTDKELKLTAKYRNRKTLVLPQDDPPLWQRPSPSREAAESTTETKEQLEGCSSSQASLTLNDHDTPGSSNLNTSTTNYVERPQTDAGRCGAVDSSSDSCQWVFSTTEDQPRESIASSVSGEEPTSLLTSMGTIGGFADDEESQEEVDGIEVIPVEVSQRCPPVDERLLCMLSLEDEDVHDSYTSPTEETTEGGADDSLRELESAGARDYIDSELAQTKSSQASPTELTGEHVEDACKKWESTGTRESIKADLTQTENSCTSPMEELIEDYADDTFMEFKPEEARDHMNSEKVGQIDSPHTSLMEESTEEFADECKPDDYVNSDAVTHAEKSHTSLLEEPTGQEDSPRRCEPAGANECVNSGGLAQTENSRTPPMVKTTEEDSPTEWESTGARDEVNMVQLSPVEEKSEDEECTIITPKPLPRTPQKDSVTITALPMAFPRTPQRLTSYPVTVTPPPTALPRTPQKLTPHSVTITTLPTALPRTPQRLTPRLAAVTPPPTALPRSPQKLTPYSITITPPPPVPSTVSEWEREDACEATSLLSSGASRGHEEVSSGGSESYGSANRAMVASHNDNSLTSLPSASTTQSHIQDTSLGSKEQEGPAQESFSERVDSCPGTPVSPASSDDDSRRLSQSPRFDDTLEQVEMFLKYGLNYGELQEYNNVLLKEQERSEQVSVEDTESPVVTTSPRKSSVASTVSSFHPEMESTRTSSLSVQRATPVPEVTVVPPCVSESPKAKTPSVRQTPPPKPPRNTSNLRATPVKSLPRSNPVTPSRTRQSPAVPTTMEHKVYQRVTPSASRPWPGTPRPGSGKGGRSESVRLPTPQDSGDRRPTPSTRPPGSGSGSDRSVHLTRRTKTPTNATPTNSGVAVRPQALKPRLHTGKTHPPPSPLLRKTPGRVPGLPPYPASSKKGGSAAKPALPSGRPSPAHHTQYKTLPSPSLQPFHKHQFKPGKNIVSPVAKELRENPPPSFVLNTKPCHKYNPALRRLERSPAHATKGTSTPLAGQRETGPVRQGEGLQDDLHTLTEGLHSDQVFGSSQERKEVHEEEEAKDAPDSVLPFAMYSKAVPVVVGDEENKENKKYCPPHPGRQPSPVKQPVMVMKHTGRVKVAKNAVSPSPRKSQRGSLMEVSIYQPCPTTD